ncbi:hypothetical protein NQZ68_017138 [Dissostichus eleginoides]|nr:hypothetical protein NQZ68_017138 [Dissostichus eleginoides]
MAGFAPSEGNSIQHSLTVSATIITAISKAAINNTTVLAIVINANVRKSGSSSGNSTGSDASSSSSLSSNSKWKATFSPISDPKQPHSDLRQGGSPFSMGGSGRGTDSDSDHKQQHHQQGRKGGEGESSSYINPNPFLSQEAGLTPIRQNDSAAAAQSEPDEKSDPLPQP